MPSDTLFLLLRAVNLGKRNKVPMKPLMESLADAGLGEPSYLLQSGNVIVRRAELPAAALKREVERVIAERFGVDTVAFDRTPEELRAVVDANPFEEPEGGSVHVSFWDEPSTPEVRAALNEGDYGADALFVAEREAYMRFAGGSQGSRLGNQLIERRLKVPATARNVRTLARLLALA